MTLTSSISGFETIFTTEGTHLTTSEELTSTIFTEEAIKSAAETSATSILSSTTETTLQTTTMSENLVNFTGT